MPVYRFHPKEATLRRVGKIPEDEPGEAREIPEALPQCPDWDNCSPQPIKTEKNNLQLSQGPRHNSQS
jgi:hypothetical protein